MFDFIFIKKVEYVVRIIERNRSKLFLGFVGDSLLEVRVWVELWYGWDNYGDIV